MRFFRVIGLVLLFSCISHPRRETEIKYQPLIILADSLNHTDPAKADSIYRLLIGTPELQQDPILAKSYFGLSLRFANRSMLDSARYFMNKAFGISATLKDTSLLLRAYLESGGMYLDPGNFESAEKEFITGMTLAKLSRNIAYQEKFLLSIGSIQVEKGNYPSALKTYFLGLKMAQNQKNKVSEAFALEQIGNTLTHTGDYREAIRYLKQAIELRHELNMNREEAAALQNLGIAYRKFEKPDSAKTKYEQAYHIFRNLNDSVKMIMVRYNIGVILKNEGKTVEAMNEMKNILSFCLRKQIFQGQMFAYHTLAALYQKQGNYPLALANVDSAIQVAHRIGQVSNLSAYYTRKHEILSASGNYKQAYQVSQMSRKMDDSLVSVEKQKEITRLKQAYETEKKEADIRFLQADNQYKATRIRLMTVVSIFGFILLIFAIISVFFFINRMRLQKIISEERNLRMEEERKLQEIEMEQLHLKSRLQEQELVHKTLVQSDLVNLNRSVKEKLSPFLMKISKRSDQEDFSKALHELSRDSQRDPLAEFEQLFRELHPGFLENLSGNFPAMSKSELQICALIRLNFSSKDIANLLSLSVTTVDTTRSHIRKKINLGQGENLTSWLMKV